MWGFQLIVESISIPRYLSFCSCLIRLSLIFRLSEVGIFFFMTMENDRVSFDNIKGQFVRAEPLAHTR